MSTSIQVTQSLITCLLFCLCLSSQCWASTNTDANNDSTIGQVTVALKEYQQLLQALQNKPVTAPSNVSFGPAKAYISVSHFNEKTSALVNLSFRVAIHNSEWVAVPLFQQNMALTEASVTINGKQQNIELYQSPQGLSWLSNKAGEYHFKFSYLLDARSFEQGSVLSLPLANTPSTAITATIPGRHPDATIIAAEGLKISFNKTSTIIKAQVSAMPGMQLSWSSSSKDPYVINRAFYQGIAHKDAVEWQVDYQLQVFSHKPQWLPLLPTTISLSKVELNGKAATVQAQNKYFAVLLEKPGRQTIHVKFWTPIETGKGPESVLLQLPAVPVSEVELSLPGEKKVSVIPATHINSQIKTVNKKTFTVARLFLPLQSEARFSWSAATPQIAKEELRANASLYHLLHAEEGVLHGQVRVKLEINRGQTNTLTLNIPPNTDIIKVDADGASVSDWRIEPGSSAEKRLLKVFLNRAISGDFEFVIAYEKLLALNSADKSEDDAVTTPLFHMQDVQRQSGMLALLAAKNLTLKPIKNQHMASVGENQLPAQIRNTLAKSVAHTYKYFHPEASLHVTVLPPERKQGKFDVSIETLVSIADVNLMGQASLMLNIKTGSLMELQLSLPDNVNILSLSGPSIRNHQIKKMPSGEQHIHVAFTQEMEGQFRLELNYERILVSDGKSINVPLVKVLNSEVEHGQIAVEALAAVEVEAAQVSHLSTLDIGSLPLQLLQKATNPILLAYRYVRSENPYSLNLKVTHHQELDVQVANIDKAIYNTLFTEDGVSVTSANFMLRNTRKQFLRLQLPADSEVWSVKVDNKTVKPAESKGRGQDEDGNPIGQTVLIKLINSREAFPIEVVYTTPSQKLGFWGNIESYLPLPDLVVTQSFWHLHLPEGLDYHLANSNLRRIPNVFQAQPRGGQQAMNQLAGLSQAIAVDVPKRGVRFSFEKLYANQASDSNFVNIRYRHQAIQQSGLWISLVLALIICVLILGQRAGTTTLNKVLLLASLLAWMAAIINLSPPLLPSLLVFALAAVILMIQVLKQYRQGRQVLTD
ncbi:MAG: hypothetical protein HRU20_08845 [Pseudomonadales bacterium]|nr:hypothetical protein [Pseudomonadales bacterium]